MELLGGVGNKIRKLFFGFFFFNLGLARLGACA